jgi:hypothetical protein
MAGIKNTENVMEGEAFMKWMKLKC